jgi:hypothetical protein
MAKKKLGYVELHWECPNCGTINPGGQTTCKGCTAPQPEDVEFFQASQQQLITNEEKLKRARAGADIHCAYCGTRNPAGATHCSQCKAELAEGKKRKSGRVVGAFQEGAAKEIDCPHCGTKNTETNSRCTQCGGSLREAPQQQTAPQPQTPRKANPAVFAIIGLVFISLCAAIYFLFLRTDTLTGTVTGVEWQRGVMLEQIVPVEYQDWLDQIPADGELIACSQEARGETDTPVEGSAEVCGTPYNVDDGSGYAEVVQDCIYIIYEDFCSYTVMEWAAVETLVTTGTDMDPFWADPALAQDQRLGYGSESYTIFFEADGDSYVYQTDNYDLFSQAEPGTRWDLEVNSVGGVQSISP